ncbi:threonine ammonia-lyase IlvA [Blastococcus sp. Marseille-P5729]|uniref:threonine ammonia-lyase IlvA n=1 Tax=Blastococcus sp. Marseille-P5729 TaxID=2086582 RepID=UPI000D10B0DF|nr:threonine ammonia-lyase IlvA [Blastococcus sp. Marseille-P5729]
MTDAPTPHPVAAPPTAADVAYAAARLRTVVRQTALDPSERLSQNAGLPVLLKREDTQVCRSYKVRGAYNFISSIASDQRQNGIVCASAGNHAQGVAFACRRLGIRGKVFLPTTTPRQKRQRIKEIGGEWLTPVITGGSYDEASRAAFADSAQTGALFVHPFDAALTIAGQGSVGVEIPEAMPGGDTVLVPVGGGGLLAGICLWIRENKPDTRIVGVEPEGAASMQAALDAGLPVVLPDLDTFVDGAAVARVGDLSYELVRNLVDQVISVPEGAVCTEMLELYQNEGIIAEPAGALASAALRGYLDHEPDGPVVCVVSGGNNDVSRYAEILERSLIHEGLRHYFLVTFPQEPGALRGFLADVLGEGEDIVLFEYVKKNNRETGPALVGIELDDAAKLPSLLERIEQSPLSIERIEPGSPLSGFLL